MLKIWGRPTSICTQRALWTLVEADVPFELTLASATMGPNGHVSGGGPAFGHVNSPEYRSMNRTAPFRRLTTTGISSGSRTRSAAIWADLRTPTLRR